MHVCHLPDYRQNNPYQQLLSAAITYEGVRVSFGQRRGRFALLHAIRTKPSIDVVHLHWTEPYWLDPQSIRSLLAAFRFLGECLMVRRCGIGLVWTIHNVSNHEMVHLQLERWVYKQLCRLAQSLIVHCPVAAITIQSHLNLSQQLYQKIHVIGHGHFIDYYQNNIPRQAARAYFGYGTQQIVLLYFGQLRSYKGVLSLVETFHQLPGHAFRLLIAGQPTDDNMKRVLQKTAKKHPAIDLHLYWIPDNEIQRFMNAADVIVLPFRHILSSSTILLSMSFGKAIIAPALGCLPQAVDNEGCLFYDPEQEDGLLHCLQTIPTLDLQQMGAHNFVQAQQMTWRSVARRTVQLYKRCCYS